MRMEAILLAAMLVAVASVAMAAGEINVTVSGPGKTYTYAGVTTVASAEVNAGTVYEYNVDYSAKTGYWAGIYGNITGKYILGDGTSNLYTWTVSAPTGNILITYTQTPDFANVSTVADAATLYGLLTQDINGWSPDADQNVDKTFTVASDADCTYAGATLAANVEGNYQGKGYWPVCAYQDDANNVIFASPIDATGVAFDGSAAQYEAIVAANATGTTIYFFKG